MECRCLFHIYFPVHVSTDGCQSGILSSFGRSAFLFQSSTRLDTTWESAFSYLNWTMIEPGMYLLAACLPCYRPLVRRIYELIDRRSHSKGSTNDVEAEAVGKAPRRPIERPASSDTSGSRSELIEMRLFAEAFTPTQSGASEERHSLDTTAAFARESLHCYEGMGRS